MRLAVLVEAGTHVVVDAEVDSYRVKERVLVERLAPSMGPGMLVLADRGLPGVQLWTTLAATGAHLLWRVPKLWKLPVEEVLADGSWISTVHGGRGRSVRRPQAMRVRVVEYFLDIPGHDPAERYGLITTLMDPAEAPATELAALYSERWEVESTLAEWKTTQLGTRTVLPSKTPDLVFQEVYAHLAVYSGLRVLMHTTAVSRAEPLDPDRLSFAAALRAARRSVTSTPGSFPPHHLRDRPTNFTCELEQEINPPAACAPWSDTPNARCRSSCPGAQTAPARRNPSAVPAKRCRSSMPQPQRQTLKSTALFLNQTGFVEQKRMRRTAELTTNARTIGPIKSKPS